MSWLSQLFHKPSGSTARPAAECRATAEKLFGAIYAGDLREVETILATGIDPDMSLDPEGGSPLYTAITTNTKHRLEIVRCLLEHGADPNAVGFMRETLEAAVGTGDAEIVRSLLAAGADPTKPESRGARELAVGTFRTEIIAQLDNAAGHDRSAAGQLRIAAGVGDVASVKQLLGSGQDFEPSQLGSVLQWASRNNHGPDTIEIAGALLSAGADVDFCDEADPYTALMSAASAGNAELARFLVESAADPTVSFGRGRAALQYCEGSYREGEIADLLRSARPTKYDAHTLVLAAACGAVEIVRHALDFGVDVNARDGARTAIIAAAGSGNLATLELLLARGADPNSETDPPGGTPLGAAIGARDETAVRVLLAAGADPGHPVGARGEDPADYASWCGAQEIARIVYSARVRIADEPTVPKPTEPASGETSTAAKAGVAAPEPRVAPVLSGAAGRLIAAAAAGDLSAVNALLGSGEALGPAALNAALVRCSWRNPSSATVDVARALLAAGADPDSQYKDDGRTVLHFAVQSDNLELVRLLVEAGADPTRGYLDGHSVLGSPALKETSEPEEFAKVLRTARPRTLSRETLLAAVNDGAIDIVRQVVEAGSAVEFGSDEWGFSPGLVLAGHRGHADIAALLLAHGANPNLAFDYSTPLTAAVESSSTAIVGMLLEAGADVHARPKLDKRTALERVEAMATPESLVIAQMLRGADGKESAGGISATMASSEPKPLTSAGSAPVALGSGTSILKFPDRFQDRYRRHLLLAERLKAAAVYPELRVYGLRAASPEASVPHLIVITGSLEATSRLADTFYTRQAEDFIATECAGDWNAINPASSLANVADPGCRVDLEAFERLVGEIVSNAYAVERVLD